MTLGDKVKHARMQFGVSQKRLAGMTGLTQPAISYIERGVNIPTVQTLQLIATALGIELSILVANDIELQSAQSELLEVALTKLISQRGLIVRTPTGKLRLQPHSNVTVKMSKTIPVIELKMSEGN